MPWKAALSLVILLGALTAAPSAHAAYSITQQNPAPGPVAETQGTITYSIQRALGDPTQATVTIAGSGAAPATPGADVGSPEPAQINFDNNPLQTSTTVTVPLVDDGADEPDETFTVTVTPNMGAPASTTTTLTDNDITVNVSPVTVAEGGTATITLSPSATPSHDTRVDFATIQGTAASDADFTPANGTLTWPAGDGSARTVTIATAGDALDEEDEALGLLTASSTDTVTPATVVTITDDDPPPLVGALSTSIPEGDTGTEPVQVAVALSQPSGRTVRVPFSTRDGTADAPGDYGTVNGTVTFAPGETRKLVTAFVRGDRDTEPNETFTIVLGTPENATLSPEARIATVTITDDDAAGGTPTSASGEDVRAPRVRLGALRRTSSSRVTLTLTCPRGERFCRSTVTLFTVPSRRSPVRALRSERRLARTTLRLTGGQTRRATLRVSAATRRLLGRARSVRVRAFAVTTDAAGNVASTSRGATLRFRG